MPKITRPRASDVEVLENYTLLLTFTNGEKRIFDVNPYFNFKPFEELKSKTLFETVHIAGLSIEWLHGQDICPDELYYNSLPAKEEIYIK